MVTFRTKSRYMAQGQIRNCIRNIQRSHTRKKNLILAQKKTPAINLTQCIASRWCGGDDTRHIWR